MHRVLSIVELLDSIFAFADKQSNANNACVCKQWSEICLATLWRDVDDLYRLFRILSPLKKTSRTSIKYEFTRYPEKSDWKRFDTYCRLVRQFSFSNEQSLQFRSVLDIVGRNRPRLNLFLNSHTLKLLGTPAGPSIMQYSVMFMHENVKHFVVTLPDQTHQPIYCLPSYFYDVTFRMPMLTHLELRDNRPMHRGIDHDVLDLIHGFPNLHVIVLPPSYLTSIVIGGLSRLSNLAEINHTNDFYMGEILESSLAEGAFPSLHHLAIMTCFSNVTEFLKFPFSPSNLTVLRITSYSWEEPSEVHELSVAVAENCRLLTTFYLSSMVYSGGTLEETPMTLDALRPLLSCSKMTTFEIVHRLQLSLQLEDIEEIASKWPSLDTLILNNDPVLHLPRESQLTLWSLLPFARHCPRLQHLGLFLHASAMDIPAAHELQFFQRLKCLSVGTSSLAQEGPVAFFLSRICPIGCRVTACPGELDINRDKWEIVDQMLPLLIAARVEERERMREEGMAKVRMLETKLEALRGKHGNDTIAM